MVMDVLAPIGHGIQYGTIVTQSKLLEDSVRAGANGFMTLACQSTQVTFTLLQADRALEAASMGTTPLAARIIIAITPGLLTWILYMGVENDTARDIVVFLQDQIGNLCQVAGVVSSVALIFFGQVLLGAVSVGFLGVGFLDRNGLLPECVRHIIHDYTPTVGMMAGLVFGGIIERIYAVANIAMLGYSKYHSYQASQQLAALEAKMTPEMRAEAAAKMDAITQKDARLIAIECDMGNAHALQGPLTVTKLQEHLNTNTDGGLFGGFWGARSKLQEVDHDHIYYRTRPTAPNVDFRELKTMFDKIDWTYRSSAQSSSALDVLRRKCAMDERFKKRQGNPLKTTEEAAAAIDVIRKACAESAGFRARHKDPLIKNKEGTAYLMSDESLIQYAKAWRDNPLLKDQLSDPMKNVEHGNIYVMTDERLKAHAKQAMATCIDQIYNRHIPDGEPRDYDELHDNLKIITHALQLKATEGELSIRDKERIDTLLTLAVDGGGYCGPGKYEVVERLYAGLVCEGGNCPTRKKVLNILQDKRSEQVMAMYADLPDLMSQIPKMIAEELKKPALTWCDWSKIQFARGSAYLYNLMVDLHDKHVYNQFLNMFAPNLGIRKAGADNDATAVIDPVFKQALNWVADSFKEDFLKNYSDDDILEAVTEKIGTSGLTTMDVVQWWQNWIERQQDLTAMQKEELSNNLLKGADEGAELFGSPFYDEDGSITKPFVVAMLYDMGVFGEQPAVANP